MNCNESRQWLDAYHDGELDLPHSVELETHLRDCPACAQSQQNLTHIREGVRTVAYTAPDRLRRRIGNAIRSKDEPLPSRHVPVRWWFSWGLGAVATVVLLGLILAQTVFHPGENQRMLDEITDSHIRSLIGAHLVDVASSDQHTVRPWFEGKIDYAPPVRDLSASGFQIVGGRLDYIAGQPTAALVYQTRKHYISLFVRASASPRSTPIGSLAGQRGYHVVHWESGQMNYWAISEIGVNELRQFAEAFESQAEK